VRSLFGVAHLARARHATCDEHGELVELSDQPSIAATPALAQSRVEEAATLATRHGHDHCTAAAHRQQRALSATCSGAAPAARAPAPSDPLALASPLTRALPLLLVAPKTSPPLA
jgi:hypothetical protein